jgi:hypothetical protein
MPSQEAVFIFLLLPTDGGLLHPAIQNNKLECQAWKQSLFFCCYQQMAGCSTPRSKTTGLYAKPGNSL